MPDETPKYHAVLTEAGAALEARALAEGRGIVLTHIAVGDANLEDVTPDPAVTALVHEVHRRPIDARSLDGTDPRITLLHAVIPASEGGWWIRELGVIGRLEDDAEGGDNPDVLYAYANHAPYYKMLPQDGQTVTHEITVPIVQSTNARLTIQVADDGYATRRQLLALAGAQAETMASIIRLSDRFTRHELAGLGSQTVTGATGSGRMSPAGYPTAGGATVAPVSIVPAGGASPAGAALSLHIESVNE